MAQHGGLLPQSINGKLGSGKTRLGPYAKGVLHSLGICFIGLFLLRAFGISWATHSSGSPAAESDAVARRGLQDASAVEPVLVSYSYYEKDQIQKSNMEFFMAVGMGLFSQLPAPAATDFVIVISGGKCTPCKAIMPMLKAVPDSALLPTISAAWTKVSGVVIPACSAHEVTWLVHPMALSDWAMLRLHAQMAMPSCHAEDAHAASACAELSAPPPECHGS